MTGERVNHDLLEYTVDDLMTYNGKPFTGIGYELSLEGNLVCEISYVNGIRAGVSREWYESGQLADEDYYAYGSPHGLFREWFENGNLKVEGECELSICIYKKEWNEYGDLILDYRLTEESPTYSRLLLLRKFKFY